MPVSGCGRVVIRMAYSTFLQRTALVIVPAALLVSCIGDVMGPPVKIGAAPPSLLSPPRLEGRVADDELLGPVGAPVASTAGSSRTYRGSAAADYLDTPNLAGVSRKADDPLGVEDPRSSTGFAGSNAPAATVDQQSVMLEPSGQQPMPQTDAYAIPDEGVNIDAELGVGGEDVLGVGDAATPAPRAPVAAQIIVPQGAMAIAEGQTSHTVVDGIGTDNPTTLLPPQGQAADPAL